MIRKTLLARTNGSACHRAGLAAVTLRIYLPFGIASGMPFEEAYPAIAWLCWVPNLIVAEWLILSGTVAPLEQST